MKKCVQEDKKACFFNKERQGKMNNKNVCKDEYIVFSIDVFEMLYSNSCRNICESIPGIPIDILYFYYFCFNIILRHIINYLFCYFFGYLVCMMFMFFLSEYL